MGDPRLGRPWHYLVAIADVAIVYLIGRALMPRIGQDVPVMMLLTISVVAAAWVGGVGPGLLATLLSVAVARELAVRPDDVIAVSATGYVLRLAVFGVLGILVSALSELRRQAVAHVEATRETVASEVRARRSAEERYQRIVESTLDGVWEVDADGRTVYANPRLEQMLGYGPGELIGVRALELVAAESLEDARRAWDRRAANPADGARPGAEYQLLRKDGSALWVHSKSAPVLDADGRFIGGYATVTDTTARREAERALRANEARRNTELEVVRVLARSATLEQAYPRLLEAIGEGLDWDLGTVWFVDGEANVLRCASLWRREAVGASFASATSRMTFSPGVGLPGRIWTACEPAWVPDLSADQNFTRRDAAREAGLSSGFGFPILAGGTECIGVVEFYSLRARPREEDMLHGAAAIGSQIGLFVSRKRSEEERASLLAREQAARQEAEAANRAKDEFLATLSHELRTPLNSIVGWSHLLRTGQLDAVAAARAVEVIDRNARAQSQIIADVLDVSRIIMGKLKLTAAPVGITPAVESAIESMRAAAAAKSVRIETAFDPRGAEVSGDADRLRQVVWNLVSNAVKFTPQGGRVLVQVRRAGSHVEIRVEDDGVGIGPAFLPHVFERFRQSDQSTTRRHGGLGLGLALVRHLVELHGGAVSVSSRGENQGAEFVVRLPLMVAAPLEPASRPAGAAAQPSTAPSPDEPAPPPARDPKPPADPGASPRRRES